MKLSWKTISVPVENLKTFELNPRKITQTKINALKRSIKKFDLVDIPVVDSDYTVISGNQRVSGA